ncbi:hypothetical protein SOPP22_16390 [Shewanella sp. OPT22]|nr:hypothetical protein SOPP22_16390 [Shewanella sp. OPT22]
MNKKSQPHNGFTLIELVIVIVILGVLAVIAVPKLFDFSSDARKAAIEQTAGTIKSAIKMVHMKAEVAGVAEDQSAVIKIAGKEVEIRYGYPKLPDYPNFMETGLFSSIDIGSISLYGKTMNNTSFDWVYQGMGDREADGVSRPAIDIGFGELSKDGSGSESGISPSDTNCYMRYFSAKGSTPATIEATLTGC